MSVLFKNTQSSNRFFISSYDLIFCQKNIFIPIVICVSLLSGCQSMSGSHNNSQNQPYPTQANQTKNPVKTDNIEKNQEQPLIPIQVTDKPNTQTSNNQSDKKQKTKAQQANLKAQQKLKEQQKAEALKRKASIRKQIIQNQKNNHSNKVIIKNGANLPAFNKLMKKGVRQLKNNQLEAAKQSFISAQRLAPQSPAVYMYLGEIALRQKLATKAEMLARRGLVVSRSKRYDIALWKLIYSSAKIRKKQNLMNKAIQEMNKIKQQN